MTVTCFEGQTALVTGGTRGIGQAVAHELARRGARLVITWHRNEAAAEAATAKLDTMCGVTPTVLRVALERPGAARDLAHQAQRAVGDIELLVANAGFGPMRPIKAVRARDWELTMRANAYATLELIQHLPALKAVVTVSSIGARRAQLGYGMLGVAKAAQEALVRQLALELAPDTRVNAVSPGLVETASARTVTGGNEGAFATAAARTPAGRLTRPEDVAKAVSFLLSTDAAPITGQTLIVDGGYELQA